jgi:4,5-dihydroxyphthalate decarboxylase
VTLPLAYWDADGDGAGDQAVATAEQVSGVRRPLTLACWDYDRTAALADGRVQPQGVELRYLSMPVEETFFRMARFGEFDAAELSLSSYVIGLSRTAPFVGVPVFPSRAFRHNGVYVYAGSGVNEPADLRGRVVGVPEYQLTAVVWIRGMLAELYGVPVESVSYRTGGLESPGRVEKLAVDVPGVEIEPIGHDRTLSELLVAGEIDALYTPRLPSAFAAGHPAVRRLWPDSPVAEREYFQKTGVFPIMHLLALRRDVYEQDRWLARSLFDAFVEAKRLAEARLGETAAMATMLPWGYEEARRVRALMGEDFWPYGLAPNEHVLRTFLRYLHEQHLSDRLYEPAELFAKETLETAVV